MQKGAAEWPCTIHQSERHSQKLVKHHHHHDDDSAISDDSALEILVLLNDEEVVERGSPHYCQSF